MKNILPNNRHEIIINNFNLPFRVVIHTNATPENISLHWHQSIEINCMLDWPLSDIYINGKTYYMKTGNIWCANSMESHYIHALENNTNRHAVSLIFPIDFVANIFPKIKQGKIKLNDFNTFSNEQKNIYHGKLFSQFKKIYKIAIENKDSDFTELSLYIEGLNLLKLLLKNFFVAQNQTTVLDKEAAQKMVLIRDYVQQNYQFKINIEDLTAILNFSKSYLSKFIKDNFNMTFNEYINLIRAEKVVVDIQNGITKQTDLATRNGFSGLRSMNRWLKKYYSANAKELVNNLIRNNN